MVVSTVTKQREILFRELLRRLLSSGALRRNMKILILCAGDIDRDLFRQFGFENVTLSNLEKNLDPKRFLPFATLSLDVEKIDLPNESFDWCFVHAGLHHCAIPQNAILEMYRVARIGVGACEPIDSLLVRASMQLGLSQRYEIASVIDKLEFRGGGLRYGGIPNWIFRFSRREVIQTIQTAHPETRHRYLFLERLVVPWERFHRKWSPKATIVRVMSPFLRLVRRVPLFANNIAFVVFKPKLPEDLQPWLKITNGEILVDDRWISSNWGYN